MIVKPSNLKGTRDFNAQQIYKRNYLFNTLTETFEQYGFGPIETPAMENLATLTGKYGEEGDQLLFKVLNNGDFLSKVDENILSNKDSNASVSQLSKRGLRYDLTVPFARFVSQNQNDISFPFKRYQIQPVWRADRPQKGRYQEFYQCDCDVVGSESLLLEAELVQIYDSAFSKLGLEVVIKINNRKVLWGLSEVAGIINLFVEMTTVIDKLDKIGLESVLNELTTKGIDSNGIEIINQFLSAKSTAEIRNLFDGKSETGIKGLDEIDEVFGYFKDSPLRNTLLFDSTLARGLSYYTGCIFEVQAVGVKMGSIGGGGRYADLTSSFGLKNVSGVGVSFGAERIYDVMEELNLFPEYTGKEIQLILLSFDDNCLKSAFKLATFLRSNGLRVDVYPDPVKMAKQMKYADSRKIPFVLIIGSDEIKSGNYSLKNLTTGEQISVNKEQIVDFLTEKKK